MRITLTTALLCLSSSMSFSFTHEVDVGFSVLGSSEPVSIDDMINGWDGDYRSGELAFADVSWDAGYTQHLTLNDQSAGRFRVSRGYRIYYFLKFNEETADFYRAQEQKLELNENKTLDLEVKHFESQTVSFSYVTPKLDLPFYDLKSDVSIGFNLYQPGHHQFGEIKGVAYEPGTSNFSANLDYRYDQFKLPWLEAEKGFDTNKGLGYSLNLGINIEKADWLVGIEAKDLMSEFHWQSSGVTVACLQTESGPGAVCDSNGGNGRSEVASVTERIPASYSGLLKHKGYDVSLHAFQHDTYQRLGLEKGQQTPLGRLGFFLYYPRLIGVSWQTSIFNVEFGSDTNKINEAHNIQLNMGANWRW